MSVVKGNGMGKGRRKEVVVGVLNGEKKWQSKSVVEMACASTMGTTIDGWNVFWCITNQSTMCSLKRGRDWVERVWCGLDVVHSVFDMVSPTLVFHSFCPNKPKQGRKRRSLRVRREW